MDPARIRLFSTEEFALEHSRLSDEAFQLFEADTHFVLLAGSTCEYPGARWRGTFRRGGAIDEAPGRAAYPGAGFLEDGDLLREISNEKE